MRGRKVACTDRVNLVFGYFFRSRKEMKFNLNGFNSVYCITDDDDGCFIRNGNGYIMEADQMIEVGKKLIATAKKKGVKQEIIEHNRKTKIEFYNGLTGQARRKKPLASSHIYLMRCDGKYKIGVSKNVEQRKKQLDGRPLPVEIIAVSPLVAGAYNIEKELHEVYAEKRLNGEWFDLTENDIKGLILYLTENL